MAVEGDGTVEEYVGGYQDYLRQRGIAPETAKLKPNKTPKSGSGEKPKTKSGKLSYKDDRELGQLPDRIAALETKVEMLVRDLADQDLYVRDPDGFQAKTDGLSAAQAELEAAEERWLELEALREELEGVG